MKKVALLESHDKSIILQFDYDGEFKNLEIFKEKVPYYVLEYFSGRQPIGKHSITEWLNNTLETQDLSLDKCLNIIENKYNGVMRSGYQPVLICVMNVE